MALDAGGELQDAEGKLVGDLRDTGQCFLAGRLPFPLRLAGLGLGGFDLFFLLLNGGQFLARFLQAGPVFVDRFDDLPQQSEFFRGVRNLGLLVTGQDGLGGGQVVGRVPQHLAGVRPLQEGQGLGQDLGHALDVNAPAGQLRRQPSVLPLPPDGQGELVVRHDDGGGSPFLQEDGEHAGRAQGVGDEDGRLGVPLDDVNLLASQLVDDGLNADAPHAHAGAHRVHAGLVSGHGDLGAGAGLPGDGLDLHGAVVDLRHLQLQQPAQHVLVAAGDDDLGAAAGAPDLQDVGPHPLVDGVPLPRHLLAARQDRFRPPQVQAHVGRRDALDRPVDELALTLGEILEESFAFRLSDPLQDDLLGGLGGNAPEVSRGALHHHR